MYRVLFTGFIIVAAQEVLAQKEASIWYFGERAGLDFTKGRPVPLANGALSTEEGSASICDENGNLLFYTDGVKVYNRLHQQMANGNNLWGSYTTTQTIIIPKPGNDQRFYIFTASPQFDYIFGANTDSVGFHYSTVDMNLERGLGLVTEKNIKLFKNATEKVTAVNHRNGNDIWVITHEWGANDFRSYLIDEYGIELNPVISRSGANIYGGGSNNSNAIGPIKASPDCKKIANVVYSNRLIEIFSFDNFSGVVGPKIGDIKNFGDPILSFYGIEFSPDSQFLYFTVSLGFCGFNGTDNPSEVWQYSIKNKSFVKVGEYVGAINAMQLGLDGKIYIASCNDIAGESGYMAVIHYPNRDGKACTFQAKALSLAGKRNRVGLPNFIASYFRFEDPVIDMPNVFTPDGDGYNPVFKPIVFDHMLDADLTIVNRWGQKVFYTRDVEAGWDGDNAPAGVYYWLLRYEGKNGKTGTAKGWVHLLR